MFLNALDIYPVGVYNLDTPLGYVGEIFVFVR